MVRSRERRVLTAAMAAVLLACAGATFAQTREAVTLPPGVRAEWSLGGAFREATPTRERVCINGLWRWQPAEAAPGDVPTGRWGYFKVPGSWPGITSYNHKDCQTVFTHPAWRDVNMRTLTAAWYEREITVPADWGGRRIVLAAEYVNSFATVYLDGRMVGEIRFPAGELDLTPHCRPGGRHVLSVHMLAMPLRAVMLSFNDTDAAREVQGTVDRRGFCGDLFLVATPGEARIDDVMVRTSVRRGQIEFDVAVADAGPAGTYRLRAQILDAGRRVAEFTGPAFRADDLERSRTGFAADWMAEKLWDIHTPENTYEVSVSLLDAAGTVLDTAWTERFGFREFWIDGRDFYLNGSRIFLSSVPLDNAQIGAAWANYDAARESLRRLKAIGLNYLYTHNYSCQPGTHLSFAEILRAADDVGILIGLSQPHLGHYDWSADDADATNGYAEHAAFYARVAGNHPSVVFYHTSHNATGYADDMNPDKIDGLTERPQSRNVPRALRAEAIIRETDPGRVVYHHSSGNLGAMHTSNFYANWAPVQEQSDWFEHWATVGVKPMFTCEYGTPISWDWSMYRGYYKGRRAFGSAQAPWEFCIAEWNAQMLGPEAYQISEREKRNLRWEAQKFAAGAVWQRWDYPHRLSSAEFDERHPVYAMYITDNWRSFRGYGLSANSPWTHGHYWQLRPGVDRSRKDFATDWDNLQRPGLSPDFIQDRYERIDLAFEWSDWIATEAAEALVRNNMPLLAFIGGKPEAFTTKDHNFLPGETFQKQLIVINNSRETVTARCRWSLGLPAAVGGTHEVTVPTGEQERIPLSFTLPEGLAPGRYELTAAVEFNTGEVQEDAFTVDVVARPEPVQVAGRVAVFDPAGDTTALLRGLGVDFTPVGADAALEGYDILIIGKGALTPDGAAPDVSRVRDGLKVILFEQTGEVLEKRFGFRIAEYGLRWVFQRVPDHPVLSGLTDDVLSNWRGDSTVLPPRIEFDRPPYTVEWAGIRVQRVWRCGNRGNVASALIEKPATGDFLTILDGGYALQYAALMEYREGQGMVMFCQTDVSGRTLDDPAADTLARNILRYVSDWRPEPRRTVVYAGEEAGLKHLEAAGFTVAPYQGGSPSADQILVVGPGALRDLAPHAAAIRDWVRAGGHVLALGLNGAQASAFLPFAVRTTDGEHIAAYFDAFGAGTLLAGVSPAEVHNGDPRALPLVTGGARPIGNGVLAAADGLNVVLCQLVPWQMDYAGEKMNVKRTFRKATSGVTRLLANMGAAARTPVLEHFARPVGEGEQRWLDGLYLDVPEEWDDPYRFFRW